MRVLISCALFTVAGCIVEAPGGTRTSSPERARAVVPQAPPQSVQVGANLENKVEIVSTTIAPGRLLPGETARVTLYFKVLDEMDVDYMVFVHVEDVDGRAERLNVDHPPAGGTYRTPQWKKGETVKDEFNVYVPPGMSAQRLRLLVGFWDPKTDARLRLENPDKVRNDGNNRIAVGEIPLG